MAGVRQPCFPLLPKQEWSAGRRQGLARPHTDLARVRPRAAGLPLSGKPHPGGVASPAREARAPSGAKGLRLPALHHPGRLMKAAGINGRILSSLRAAGINYSATSVAGTVAGGAFGSTNLADQIAPS